MSNTRNMQTYVVSDYRSVDDVANAAAASGSKVLSVYTLVHRSQEKLGVLVLRSLNLQDKVSKGETDPIIAAMNLEDRGLNS